MQITVNTTNRHHQYWLASPSSLYVHNTAMKAMAVMGPNFSLSTATV